MGCFGGEHEETKPIFESLCFSNPHYIGNSYFNLTYTSTFLYKLLTPNHLLPLLHSCVSVWVCVTVIFGLELNRTGGAWEEMCRGGKKGKKHKDEGGEKSKHSRMSDVAQGER